MSTRSLFTIGACTMAGIFILGIARVLGTWRRHHLHFDFALEDATSGLFI